MTKSVACLWPKYINYTRMLSHTHKHTHREFKKTMPVSGEDAISMKTCSTKHPRRSYYTPACRGRASRPWAKEVQTAPPSPPWRSVPTPRRTNIWIGQWLFGRGWERKLWIHSLLYNQVYTIPGSFLTFNWIARWFPCISNHNALNEGTCIPLWRWTSCCSNR